MFWYCVRTKATLPPKAIMSAIKTFVFLDLETTGLPHLENNKTKMTELTLIAVQDKHLSLGVSPRVQNKLSFCFNPQKLVSYESEKITGLSNSILEHCSSFSEDTVNSINLFLRHNPKPICFVAHNGNRFDYPILQAEIQKTGVNLLEDILCVDSLLAFRELHLQESEVIEDEIPSVTLSQDSTDSVPLEFQDGFDEILCTALEEYERQTDPVQNALKVQKINETTPKKEKIGLDGSSIDLALDKQICDDSLPKRLGDQSLAGPVNSKKPKVAKSRARLDFGISLKLGDVYQRLTKGDIVDAHRAEGDVQMLMMCSATLGDKFLAWANKNARNFNDIPAMTPGKRIPFI